VALITDGRFSGGTKGAAIGHISPEAYDGGVIALIENGDAIAIDIEKGDLNLEVSQEILKQRREKLQVKESHVTGYLKKYRKIVSSASHGAVCL